MLAGEGRASGDQLLGGGPVQPHVALGSVHGLGGPQPVAEQMTAKCESGLPVNDRWCTRDVLAAWVGDDVCRSEGDPALEWLRMLRPCSWFGELDLAPATASFWEGNRGADGRHDANQSMATRRPSADEVNPASASCKPRTPAARS